MVQPSLFAEKFAKPDATIYTNDVTVATNSNVYGSRSVLTNMNGPVMMATVAPKDTSITNEIEGLGPACITFFTFSEVI